MSSVADLIHISIKTEFIEDQSNPSEELFIFSYAITIENTSQSQVQLMNRYWKIIEVNEQTQEVAGEGVVGEQPTLNPNQRYTYTSGAIIAQPPATMEGHYEFKNAEGHCFKVPIPAFVLSIPGQLH